MSGTRKRKRPAGEQPEKGKGKSTEVIEDSEPEEEEAKKKGRLEADGGVTMKEIADDIAEGIHLLVAEMKGIRKEMRHLNRALADLVAGQLDLTNAVLARDEEESEEEEEEEEGEAEDGDVDMGKK